MTLTVTLLHPGQMGAAVGAQAVAAGHRVLWVPHGRSQETRRRAQEAGLTAVPSLRAALDASDIAISVCPPGAADQIACDVNELRFTGLYLDANAISPQRVRRIADGMQAPVLDGAIIGPPPCDKKTARLYVSGAPQAAGQIQELFKGTAVEVREAGRDLGSASALKMAFASFQKSARTLAAVAHALADTHGVSDLLTEEAKTMPSAILSDPGYLPSVAARAWRWRDEMGDIAATLRAAALPTGIADATAAVLHLWEDDEDKRDMPVREVLARLREQPR
ncbi:NAD(P)-dependent oxidoreductase [Streptomyces syringium]|uniref:NAD(P)-dependent oxidoreductase n=1 Tax=Streptomyces syringium TaxID=76729 RepID=UPI0034513EA8